MLITEVCQKDGCNGNTFYVNTKENKLITKCTVCGEEHIYDEELNCIMAPTCSSCDNEVFKVFKNNENGEKYINCVKCNNIPRAIYVDGAGKQITYEQLNLVECKEILYETLEKVSNLAISVDYIYSDICDLKTLVNDLKEY